MNALFKRTAIALAAIAGGLTAASVHAADVDTKGGIKVKSDDGQFVGELGGRMHLDAVFFQDDDDPAAPDNDNDVYFRRLRMQAKGTMYGVWEGMIQVDFRNGGNGDAGHLRALAHNVGAHLARSNQANADRRLA